MTSKGLKIDTKRHEKLTAPGVTLYTLDVREGCYRLDDASVFPGVDEMGLKVPLSAWKAMVHPKDRKRFVSDYNARLRRRDLNIETVYRARIEGGAYRSFLDRSRIVDSDEKGDPITLRGSLVDITDIRKNEAKGLEKRHQWESALARSEAEKSAILEALSGLVSIRFMNPEMRILWSNMDEPFCARQEGEKESGQYCYQVIRGRTEPCDLSCTTKNAFSSGSLKITETIVDDGRSFIIGANPVKDRSGDILGVIYFRLNVTKHKKMEEQYHVTHKFLHSFLRNSPTPITVFDSDGRISLVNPAWEKLTGIQEDQALGLSGKEIFPEAVFAQNDCLMEKVVQSGDSVEFEESIEFPSGMRHFHTVKFPLHDASGNIVNIGTISIDLTARKNAEQKLAKHEAELRIKSLQLEETNTALRVLLKQREADQRELEEKIVTNVKQLVLPYVHKLQSMHLNNNQKSCLEMVETHLNDIVAPFLRHVVSEYPHMTATEIQVATLVREGKTNKDISNLMNISVNTVQIHRHNVRKKLGLKNKKINLHSYLLSLNFSDTRSSGQAPYGK